MKSKFRENRMSGGARAKADRIVKDLRAKPSPELNENSTGGKIFAVWKARQN